MGSVASVCQLCRQAAPYLEKLWGATSLHLATSCISIFCILYFVLWFIYLVPICRRPRIDGRQSGRETLDAGNWKRNIFYFYFLSFILETDALEANTTNRIEYHFTESKIAADIWMFPILVLKKSYRPIFVFIKVHIFLFFYVGINLYQEKYCCSRNCRKQFLADGPLLKICQPRASMGSFPLTD